MPIAEKKVMYFVGADQMCRSADSLYFASEAIAEFYRRPNPKIAILKPDNYAAGWIRKPVKIDVVPVNNPNVLGDWSKGDHREHCRNELSVGQLPRLEIDPP
jgi:hypothetical protein